MFNVRTYCHHYSQFCIICWRLNQKPAIMRVFNILKIEFNELSWYCRAVGILPVMLGLRVCLHWTLECVVNVITQGIPLELSSSCLYFITRYTYTFNSYCIILPPLFYISTFCLNWMQKTKMFCMGLAPVLRNPWFFTEDRFVRTIFWLSIQTSHHMNNGENVNSFSFIFICINRG